MRKKIEDLGFVLFCFGWFFFFFFLLFSSCCGLVVVVDVCAVLGVGFYVWLPRNSKKIWEVLWIYYLIVIDILFYCDVYIILLY